MTKRFRTITAFPQPERALNSSATAAPRTLKRIAGCAIFVSLLALATSACTVGPDYTRPKAPIPVAYKEMAGWKIAEPKDHLLRGKWWELFNNARLKGLEEQVAISNQNIAQAEAQFHQARALVQVARSAYFPTAAISASFTRSFQGTSQNSAIASPSPVSLYSLPVDVSWEPDLFGRVRRSVEASKAGAQASAADLEGVRLTIQTELAQDYFQLQVLDAQKRLLDATVSAYTEALNLTRNRYASGVASRGDVLQAETQLKTTQAQAIDVGVQRAQFEHAIAVLVGKPPSDLTIPSLTPTTPPPPIPVGVPSELLERRPDIAGAERRMAAANAQIGVAVAAFYPSVSLSAAGGSSSTDLAKWLTWPTRFWSIGPSVSELLFEGGLRKGQKEQALAAYDASVAFYRQTVLTAFQQIEDNLSALRILEEEAAVQAEAVKSAQDSVKVAMNQYKAGIVAYTNVIVAQTAELSNERVALNIQGQRMTAAALLIKALGGGWDTSALPGDESLTK